MTLVLTVNGPDTIWMLTDRRLSYNKSRPPKDDARKLAILNATDGVAILGYAGLGATAFGTEPSDWMSAVLRGRKLSLEQNLSILAAAAKEQLPKHLNQIPGIGGPGHNVIITSFVEDEPRVYSIDLAYAPDRKNIYFRYTQHVVNKPSMNQQRPPRLSMAGSGALYLQRNKKWMRGLLKIVKAHDKGQVSPQVVSSFLADLNYEVHLGVADRSVGPRCIVAWQYRKAGVHKGGGGHEFYTDTTRDTNSFSIPTIMNGMDINVIANVLMANFKVDFKAIRAGEPTPEPDKDKVNAELARYPHEPDEKLR